MKIETK